MEFIDLKTQLQTIRPAIDNRIKKVLDHGQFIMGPEVHQLEEKLADFVGVKHCISCANGTDALQLSLMALGIGPGDTVITTSFSFFATAEVIPLVGAIPYFVDIESDTYNISPRSLEKGILEAKTKGLIPKAVIAVDLFGLPANYPEIERICKQYGLYLIEDAAQGFGGSINEKKAGSFGDIATTSFFPAKPLGCFGDGGAIFTNKDELAYLCRSLRSHGKGSHKYDNERIGLNSRLDTIQAAILLEKLTVFEQEFEAKQNIASYYQENIIEHIGKPNIPASMQSSWAIYTLYARQHPREYYLNLLQHNNIPHGIYYPIGLNKQQSLQHYPSSSCDITIQASERVFSIPMHPYLTKDQCEVIISSLLD
ncbi:DegT/DnrJ/EryC1/StrS aminotransferase family protein [Paraglaciecola sp. L3A3]|uniref:DegT/DnrJ/EryC1/StrS family aminotransferase n=1 Tax=Paraglaciecola sp. L3A3 TaxID=2686358 RepID=UPI00131D480E|nr:DegT/DnrJ/EryC1/StrS family aminotransferase [Paraglaciecola sp. L3A3]